MSMDWAENGVWAVDTVASPAGDAVAALVERAIAGDRPAFAQLYRRFAPMVHGVLLAAVPALEVGDLQQDVFTQAWSRLAQLRKREAFGPWLAAIARRRATDFHRTPRAVGDVPERFSKTPHFAESLALLTAIRSLSASYRETLTLRLVEGMTGAEIAAQTGKTHRSVRVNLHRGMQKLRATLADGETTR
ncbi:MAG: sigma-70 family RNA polymerase sigma factor [Myxococcota bacterium]